MRGRPLLAVTAAVAVLHAALLLALAGQASTPAMSGTSRAAARWIVLAPPSAAGPAPRSPAATAAGASPARRDGARASRAGQGAGAGEQSPSAPPAMPPANPAAAIGIYRAATALDVPVRPRSAPDLDMLADLPWSGLPLRLRLFIDDQGNVVEARILQSAESDEVAERVRRMFLATAFTAGVEGGRPVPSYKDIELTIGTRS